MTRPQRVRRRRWLILGLLIVALGAAAFVALRRAGGPSLRRSAVEALEGGTFVREVSGTGVIEAASERRLTFRSPGIVAEILVAPGDRVESGALLARQDTASLERELASSRANLQSAQADLQRSLAQQLADRLDVQNATVAAEGALANAETELENARTALETAVQLREAGGISRDDFDRAEERRMQAERRANEARLSLDTAREREAAFVQLAAARRASAEAAVASIETAIASLQQRVAEADLLAPFAGTVSAIDFKLGESAEPLSQSAVHLVDTSSLRVRADFAENRAVDLTEGQAATIIPDADQRLRLEGLVERIGTTARQTQGAALVEVVFGFAPSARAAIDSGLIRPGFNVDVRVEVNRIEDILLVPLQAISESGDDSWIYRVNESEPGLGIVERVEIDILDRNSTVAAVDSDSLARDDLVALIDLDELESGEQIRYDPPGNDS